MTSAGGEKSLEDTASDLIRRELESLRQVSLRQLAENTGPGSLLAALDQPGWPGTTPHQFIDAAQQIQGAVRDAETNQARQLCQELVVSMSFYSTTLEVFTTGQARLIDCLKDQDYAVINELANARYAMRVNAGLAHQLLEPTAYEMGSDRKTPMPLGKPNLQWPAKIRTSAALCLVGAAVGTSLYFANLSYVTGIPAARLLLDPESTHITPMRLDALKALHSDPKHGSERAFDRRNDTFWGSGYGGTNEGVYPGASFAEPALLLNVIITPGVSAQLDQYFTRPAHRP